MLFIAFFFFFYHGITTGLIVRLLFVFCTTFQHCKVVLVLVLLSLPLFRRILLFMRPVGLKCWSV